MKVNCGRRSQETSFTLASNSLSGNCMVMIKDRDCNNGTADDDDNEDDDGDYERFTSQCAEYGGGGGGSGGCSHNGPPVKIMVSKNIWR